MHNVLMIIRREYLDRVKKKSFWIGIFLGPLLIFGLIGISIGLAVIQTQEQRHIVLSDASGQIGKTFLDSIGKHKLKNGTPAFVVETADAAQPDDLLTRYSARIEDRTVFALVVVGADPEAKGAFRFYGRNVSELTTTGAIEGALKDAVIALRLKKSDLAIDRATLDKLVRGIDLDTFEVSKGGAAQKKGFLESYVGTFVFIIILFMSILLYGVAMLRGILEEKSNRIVEMLLGSVTPDQLMTGKILGIGLVGLTQMAIYVPTFGVVRLYLATRAVGADVSGIQSVLSASKLVYFVVFFLLGYFLYTALYAAVGAVCNTEQEAQSFSQVITMGLMLPYVCTFFFVTHPDNMVAVVLSFVPLFTPMIMFMRICVQEPPLWQVLLSIAIMIVSIGAVFRVAARIFRVGILMYGKRPTIPEILRWARG